MGRRGSGFDLVVTIDTEADNMWEKPHEYSFRNTRSLDRLQRFFDERGILPTYLVTYEVAADSSSAEFLRRVAEEGRGEVGAHLHPWSNPPFIRVAQDEDAVHPYPHNYPLDVFEDKMSSLSRIIEERIGVSPKSYRAGRYGFVAAHAPVLQRFGFRVDTSVTPGVSWQRYPGAPGGARGPSFVGAPREPYHVGPESAVRPAAEGLLEVPVSIEWSRSLPSALESWADGLAPYGHVARLLRRTRVLRPTWLRPYRRFSVEDLTKLCHRLFERGRPVWNLMFHSSEATAGTSPYSRDEQELGEFYRKLGRVIELALELGGRASTLAGFADRWEARDHRSD